MLSLPSALVLSVLALAGWQDANPDRRPLPVARELYRATIDRAAVSVDWRAGAQGRVEVVDCGGRPALRIVKSNDIGYGIVRVRRGFDAPAGSRLRACADCTCESCEPGFSYGFLALWSGPEDLTYFSAFDRNGRGGPKQTELYETPPLTPDRKLCHYKTKTPGEVVLAIVVAGARSVSSWSNWFAEDFTAAEQAWKEFARKRPYATNMPHRVTLTDAELDARLAAESNHTAKIETIGAVSRFLVDGRPVQPILLKYSMHRDLRTFSGDIKLNAAGVGLFGTGVRLGYDPGSKQGYWTKDGFDVKGAAATIRLAMRRAPGALFLLTVVLDPYPEFSQEHPDEIWIDHKGRKIIGDAGHADYSQPKATDARHWHWVSNFSTVWRNAVKARLSEFIDELKRQGLSKRIVGVHLAGFHDAQFSTAHPDCSPPAKRAFADWCRSTGKGESDYQMFLKQGPLAVQNDLARHVKRAFDKDIVVVRYCMTPFGGSYNATYDITPFVECDAIDVLCAQPDYGRRVPGVPIAHRVPLESFHLHGKYFLNELDLRTYGAHTPWEAELSCMTYSRAVDYPMWCATNRKLAGQMFAKRMGWWYLDMAGGWFDPDEIVADIRDTVCTGRELLEVPPSPWHPDVALVVDEEGLLKKDLRARYFYPDEQLQNGAALQALAAAAVPTDYWLMKDFLVHPEIAARYRTIVFFGLYDVDGDRAELVRRLSSKRRRLVFLARSGEYGGSDALGFRLAKKPAPTSSEILAEPGVRPFMGAMMHARRFTDILGLNPKDWRWRYYSPERTFVEPEPDQKVVARYTEDGTAAVVERSVGNSKLVYVAPFGGLTPGYLHALAAESGAYLPTAESGYEVDMNGDFISLHSLRNGPAVFRLPFAARVRNLKTGEEMPGVRTELRLDLTAGETRWYRLRRSAAAAR